jgi:signal transduction histidine kinase
MEKGAVTLQLSPCFEDSSFLEIMIVDTGIGIPEDKLSLLSTGKNPASTYGTAREKGTGLGLSICFELVKLIGGKLTVTSQAGKGTRISLLVPASEKA